MGDGEDDLARILSPFETGGCLALFLCGFDEGDLGDLDHHRQCTVVVVTVTNEVVELRSNSLMLRSIWQHFAWCAAEIPKQIIATRLLPVTYNLKSFPIHDSFTKQRNLLTENQRQKYPQRNQIRPFQQHLHITSWTYVCV